MYEQPTMAEAEQDGTLLPPRGAGLSPEAGEFSESIFLNHNKGVIFITICPCGDQGEGGVSLFWSAVFGLGMYLSCTSPTLVSPNSLRHHTVSLQPASQTYQLQQLSNTNTHKTVKETHNLGHDCWETLL